MLGEALKIWDVCDQLTGGIEQTPEGSVVEALTRNCRFGFVAGGLDDRGIYSGCFDSDQVQYSPGLTGLFVKNTRVNRF